MRRVDRRTNALTDQPTDRPTDTASYRGALSHLKNLVIMRDGLTSTTSKTKSTAKPEKEKAYMNYVLDRTEKGRPGSGAGEVEPETETRQ